MPGLKRTTPSRWWRWLIAGLAVGTDEDSVKRAAVEAVSGVHADDIRVRRVAVGVSGSGIGESPSRGSERVDGNPALIGWACTARGKSSQEVSPESRGGTPAVHP